MYAKKGKGQKTITIHGPMRDKKVLKEIRKRRSRRVKNKQKKKCPDCKEGWHCKGDDLECECWCVK